nr:hypothetical protein CFP56_00555 [Quercus suber]
MSSHCRPTREVEVAKCGYDHKQTTARASLRVYPSRWELIPEGTTVLTNRWTMLHILLIQTTCSMISALNLDCTGEPLGDISVDLESENIIPMLSAQKKVRLSISVWERNVTGCAAAPNTSAMEPVSISKLSESNALSPRIILGQVIYRRVAIMFTLGTSRQYFSNFTTYVVTMLS